MLTREFATLMQLKNDPHSYLYSLRNNTSLLCRLSLFIQTSSGINKALQLAAFARQEDIDALMQMLEVNPDLLCKTGTVITPGGNIVENISLYPFLLRQGDPEVANMVGSFYAKLPGGDTMRTEHNERFRPLVEDMFKQPHYDLTHLFDVLIAASADDVTAILNNDMTHQSALRDEIMKFREHHAPHVINTPCMHYNYTTLLHAYHLLNKKWDELQTISEEDFVLIPDGDKSHDDRIDVVCQSVLGFKYRRFPGVDRCYTAQGLSNKHPKRTYAFEYSKGNEIVTMVDTGEFPVTLKDTPESGLGYNFTVDTYAGKQDLWVYPNVMDSRMGQYLKSKQEALLNVCNSHPEPSQDRTYCVIS